MHIVPSAVIAAYFHVLIYIYRFSFITIYGQQPTSTHSPWYGAAGGTAGGTYGVGVVSTGTGDVVGGEVVGGEVVGGEVVGREVVCGRTVSTTGAETSPTGMPTVSSSLPRVSIVVEFASVSAWVLGTVTMVSTSMEVARRRRRVTTSVTVPITTLETCVENARATPVV